MGLHFSRKFLLIRHLVNLLLPRLPRAAKRLLTSRSPPFTPQVSRLTILNSKLPTRRKHWMFLSFDFHRFYLPGITLHLLGSQEIYLGRRKSCANLLKPRLPTALGGSACDSVKQFWGISICRQVFPSFVFPCQPVALPYFEQEILMVNFSHMVWHFSK